MDVLHGYVNIYIRIRIRTTSHACTYTHVKYNTHY